MFINIENVPIYLSMTNCLMLVHYKLQPVDACVEVVLY